MPSTLHFGVPSLMLLALAGCAWLWGPWPVHPVTTGYHSPAPQCWAGSRGPMTYAVWSKHPAVSQYLTGAMLQMRHRVVERARLQELFDEQKFRLRHTPDSEADLLRVGRMAGATHMIFAEVSDRSRGYGSHSYTMSVSVRSVNVETGEVCWSGTASTPEPISSPRDSSAITGAYWAMARALCLMEAGYRWEEPSAKGGGCKEPSAKKAVTRQAGKP